jgi:nucleoside-diphosphate-sugar epimerase
MGNNQNEPELKKNDLIVITGAGGFIGGNLAKYFTEKGFTRIRAVDKKPFDQWYQRVPGVENLQLDCSREDSNTHMIEAAYQAGVRRYFYSSSACAYNTLLQRDPNVTALKESDAYPAMAERGYGWEKLISEMFCQEYWAERGMKTFIARFHNVYGPFGTWDGGREKAPAAICRKVVEAIDQGSSRIEIWGDGTQTRSFMYIADCVQGIDMIMHCEELIATPINLGSSELVSINELVSKIERIAGVTLKRVYDPTAPHGVGGRNSDNTFIKQVLKWEPNTTLDAGLRHTYEWIKGQYQSRQQGMLVVA